MLRKTAYALLVLLMGYSYSVACTSAVISAKATLDGRPILWKNRDTSDDKNKLMYVKGSSYAFIGVANNDDPEGSAIFMGSNEAGFSILNTLSYNLYPPTASASSDKRETLLRLQEGAADLIRNALGTCATLEDFEELLKNAGAQASNFGVIDRAGGAAYYEVSTAGHTKFDVNDHKTAPLGYLIRTNFAQSADLEEGMGFIRYGTIEELFLTRFAKEKFTVEFILQHAVRNLNNALTRMDISKMTLPRDLSDTTYIPSRDSVARYSTASAVVMQGVAPGEDPSLTTIWTVLGMPLVTLVTPVWVAGGDGLPRVVVSQNGLVPPINQVSLNLKEICFPFTLGHGTDYLQLSSVMNEKGTGLYQLLMPKEKMIIQAATAYLKGWRSTGFDKTEVLTFYTLLDAYVAACYTGILVAPLAQE